MSNMTNVTNVNCSNNGRTVAFLSFSGSNTAKLYVFVPLSLKLVQLTRSAPGYIKALSKGHGDGWGAEAYKKWLDKVGFFSHLCFSRPG